METLLISYQILVGLNLLNLRRFRTALSAAHKFGFWRDPDPDISLCHFHQCQENKRVNIQASDCLSLIPLTFASINETCQDDVELVCCLFHVL